MSGAKKGIRCLGCMMMIIVLLLGLMAVAMPETAEAKNEDIRDAYEAEIKFKTFSAEDGIPVWDGINSVTTKPAGADITGNVCTVTTPEALRWAMTQYSTNSIAKIVIAADMDMGGREDAVPPKWEPVTLTGAISIEGQRDENCGYYGGREYPTIYNLNVETASGHTGFIASTSGDVNIKNFYFDSAKIRTTSSSGVQGVAIIGYAGNGLIMENIGVENSLSKTAFYGAAGLIGKSAETTNGIRVTNCYAKKVYVTASQCSGGLLGPISGGEFNNCYAIDGALITTGGGHSGGFVSCSGGYTMNNCFTNNVVYGTAYTGGFVGYPEGKKTVFNNCWTAGSVEGTSSIGGFVGHTNVAAEFNNCYSTTMVGMLNSGTSMGGFVGYAASSPSFKNCYAAGEVGGLTTVPGTAAASVGGFVGSSASTATYSNCYYDKQTTAMGEYAKGGATDKQTGITGLTTEELQRQPMDAYTIESGLYPQLNTLANPADTDFSSDYERLTARAYSAASASSAIFNVEKDKNTGAIKGYDTVRNILKPPTFSNNTVVDTGKYNVKWTAGSDASPLQIEQTKKDDKGEPVLDADGNPEKEMVNPPVLTIGRTVKEDGTVVQDDHITRMYPGVGWANVEVAMTEGENTVVGKRAMRIIPTTTMSLGESDHPLAPGSKDSRIYVGLQKNDGGLVTDVDQKYNHRNTIAFVKTSAEELDNIMKNPGGSSLSAIRYNPDITDTGYTNIAVDSANADRGKITTTIYKVTKDPDDPSKEIETLIPDLSQNNLDAKFRGEKDFTNGSEDASETVASDDRGTYRIKYKWEIPVAGDAGAVTTYEDSKTLTVTDPLTVTYYNNVKAGDPDAAEYANPEGFEEADQDTAADKAVFDIYGDNDGERALKVGDRTTALHKKVTGDDGVETTIDAPSRIGYTFAGWSKNRQVVADSTRDEEMTDGDIRLADFKQELQAFTAANPESPDYTEPANAFIPGKSTVSADTKVYAVWENNAYDVHFDFDPSAAEPAKPGDGKTVEDIVYNGSVQEGDFPSFNGVPIAENFVDTTAVDDEGKPKSRLFTGWSVEDPSKAVAPAAETEEEQDPSEEKDISFTKDSKITKDLFGKEAFARDAENAAAGKNTQLEIYSVFKDAQITFLDSSQKQGGDTPETADQLKQYGEKANVLADNTFTLPDMTAQANARAGYKFLGWSAKPHADFAATDKDFSAAELISEDKLGKDFKADNPTTLYAVWQNTGYVVTFDYGPQGTEAARVNMVYGQAIGDKLPETPQNWMDSQGQQWRFDGWKSGTESITAETIKNEGQVSGDAMTVKAQWKKVYDILTAKVGHGTIDSSKTVDEGSSYSVSWKADEGYHVAQVMIDNGVHDELLGDGHSGSYTQPRADRNRTIYVIFEKDADTPSGEAHYYTVQTVKIGGDATTTLTETQTIAAGENHTVTWNAGDLYRVTGIVVDGSARPLQDGGSFTFSDMNADHRVEVHFEEKLPDSSPSALPGYYTVNTVRNEGGVITETGVVKEGASREIAWSEDAGYAVKSITIDGQPADAEIMAAKKVTFNDIREDHTVKAVFEKNGEALSTVKVPVETTLVGGPGEISSSAVVNKDESYKVEWNAPEDKRYLVDHILVNGERQEVAAEAVTTGHIEVKAEAETKVEVVLKPNLLKIATMVEGQGSIDPTKTVFYNDEAYTVAAKASDGWYIKSYQIDDGEEQTVSSPQSAALMPMSEDEPQPAGDNSTVVIDVPSDSNNKIVDNHRIKVTTERLDGSAATELFPVATGMEGGTGTITAGSSVEKGGSMEVSWTPDEGYATAGVSVTASGVPIPVSYADNHLILSDIADPYQVTVQLRPVEKAAPETAPKYSVSTSISGAPGASITPSLAGNIEEGSDVSIGWSWSDTAYEVKAVKVDGQPLSGAVKDLRSYAFSQVNTDHSIEVVLGKPDTNPAPDADTFKITTECTTGGSISASSVVAKGDTTTVTWAPDSNDYTVKAIHIDGVKRDDLLTTDHVVFENVAQNHFIAVEFGKAGSPDEPEAPDEPAKTYTISTEIVGGIGSTIDSSRIADENETVTISWKPGSNAYVTTVIIDNVVRDDLKSAGSVTFENITADHRVQVVCQPIPPAPGVQHRITVSKNGQGQVNGTKTVETGASYEVCWEADSGWHVESVKVDNIPIENPENKGSVRFEKIDTDHQVEVVFKKDTDETPSKAWPVITGIIAGNGSISAGNSSVPEHGDYSVSWKPAEGWHTARVFVNNAERKDLLDKNSVTLTNITQTQTVQVEFAKDTALPPEPDNPAEPGKPENPDTSGPSIDPPDLEIPDTNAEGSVLDKIQKEADKILPRTAKASSIAPNTGIRDGGQSAASASGISGKPGRKTQRSTVERWISGEGESLLSHIVGKSSSNAAVLGSREISVFNLLAVMGAMLLMMTSLKKNKVIRWTTTLVSLALLTLFFLTQPLSLSFRLFDPWSVIFGLLILLDVAAAFIKKRSHKMF